MELRVVEDDFLLSRTVVVEMSCRGIDFAGLRVPVTTMAERSSGVDTDA